MSSIWGRSHQATTGITAGSGQRWLHPQVIANLLIWVGAGPMAQFPSANLSASVRLRLGLGISKFLTASFLTRFVNGNFPQMLPRSRFRSTHMLGLPWHLRIDLGVNSWRIFATLMVNRSLSIVVPLCQLSLTSKVFSISAWGKILQNIRHIHGWRFGKLCVKLQP